MPAEAIFIAQSAAAKVQHVPLTAGSSKTDFLQIADLRLHPRGFGTHSLLLTRSVLCNNHGNSGTTRRKEYMNIT